MPFATYRSIVVVLAIALISACSSTPKATMDYDTSFDFSQVRSIYIQPFDRNTPATVKVSDIQVGRVTDALTAELVRRGYLIVEDRASADMFLSWHLVTEERADVRTYNSYSYYNCWRCVGPVGPGVTDVSVNYYTQGSFFVDMIDPKTLRSVWRSVIESRLRSQPDPEKAAENRAAAAEAVFLEFPPGRVVD